MARVESADKCLNCYLEKKGNVETAFDRMEKQKTKCKHGASGTCCRLCSNGPCKITPDSSRGVCGANVDSIVARNFLRTVAAGSACYLHVLESAAQRLKSIGKGISPLKLRSEKTLHEFADCLGIPSGDAKERALLFAEMVLDDIYKPSDEKMRLVEKLSLEKRLNCWRKLGIIPGGAKSEILDALVKTSTNLNTDPVDQLLHCLRLGISTGVYGLVLTNIVNDIVMGEPEIGIAETGFSVVDPAYVNIAVTGHNHSVFATLIELLESDTGQDIARKQGAEGIKIIGMTCVGQDMQLRQSSVKDGIFAGQAGNNFTQEALVATGGIDMLVSEFNCTLSGVESIAAEQMTKLVCLDAVSKQSSAELLEDKHGNEKALAEKLANMAVEQYAERRKFVKIDIPEHGHNDVVAGISEKSLIAFLGGSLNPLINLIKSGAIKGVAGILGCSNLAAGGHDTKTVELTKELIKRDILVLSAGCTSGGLANCGLCSLNAKDYAGPGLKAVCENLGIPPVLNFGPCLSIGRIEIVVNELAKAMNLDIPDLPVVISAPQWLEEQALADGSFGLALGLTVHLSQAPPILGSPVVTKVLTEDMASLTGGRVVVEGCPSKAADILCGIIDKKLKRLSQSIFA